MRHALALAFAFVLAPGKADGAPERPSKTVLSLQDEAGRPLANRQVVLTCAHLAEPLVTTTTDEGLFVFESGLPLEGCTLVAIDDEANLQAELGEVGPRATIRMKPQAVVRKIVVKARPVRSDASVGRTVSMEEFRNIPVGSARSRDFTAVVESSSTASGDSAGISLAGTTGAESAYAVEGASFGTPGRRAVRRAARRDRKGRVARNGSSPAAARHAQRQQHRYAGILTAAAVDDVDNPDAFRRYLGTVTHPARERFTGRHKILQVVDPFGRPVAGAVVTAGSRTYRTRRDGRVVLVPGLDPIGSTDQTVVVKGLEGLSSTAHADVTQVVLDRAIEPPSPRVDLALVVDTTGSMADELMYLQSELGYILQALEDEYANLDIRWGLVLYRDVGDDYVAKRFDFTADFDAFATELSQQVANGGGDTPEAVDLAFKEANALDWRDAAIAGRVLVHIADAAPHDAAIDRTFEEVDVLRRNGTAIYPVAASGTDELSEFTMRSSALVTGGQYVFLTDHSGIGGSHREATAACYRVDTLLNVLTKILSAEIEGRRAELPIGPDGTGCADRQQQ